MSSILLIPANVHALCVVDIMAGMRTSGIIMIIIIISHGLKKREMISYNKCVARFVHRRYSWIRYKQRERKKCTKIREKSHLAKALGNNGATRLHACNSISLNIRVSPESLSSKQFPSNSILNDTYSTIENALFYHSLVALLLLGWNIILCSKKKSQMEYAKTKSRCTFSLE